MRIPSLFKQLTLAAAAGLAASFVSAQIEALATKGRRVAAERRRAGANASRPTDIPAAGWKAILKRTYDEVGNDRVLAVAAGVTFYGLLALFPAVTAFVSL